MTQPDTQALPHSSNADASRVDATIRLLASLIAQQAVAEILAEGDTTQEEHGNDPQDDTGGNASDR